ncbi:MAG: methylated-DNA--[protein]-cysteine S-methyltransferase [Rhodospirillales bacterium]|nr:methylated-DNA--[protein]-cysteine S-methyltransferase [Rhodospirillales bacterium]
MAHLTIASPLGPLTLFEDKGALVAVEWGTAPSAAASSPLLRDAARQLAAYFDGRLQVFGLPLKPRGTPFQVRVWDAMARIPFGQTRSYGALARGLATGSRAVASACGRNPLPILIPCHRVIGQGPGGRPRVGGYSGGEGPETKRFLLGLEGVTVVN